MSCLSSLSNLRYLGVASAIVTLSLVASCSRAPSQEDMEYLEQRRQATLAAELKVTELQAEKAQLERDLAERQATKKALEAKLAATKNNLANQANR